MVVVNSAETKSLLPHLTLESMTKHQLEEFIPQLVTKVTGRTSPQFGSLKDKPDWWPGNLEWTNPKELSEIYQDPCDKLREIVRSGYFHMDQDNLLNSSDLTDFNAELPLSPATEDIPTSQESEEDRDQCTMTIQCSEPCVINLDDSMEIVSDNLSISDKTDDGVLMEVNVDDGSECDKVSDIKTVKTSECKIEGTDSDNDDEIAKEIKHFFDCTANGITVNTVKEKEDISDDIIAQIDEQIANSLKEAFSNINALDFGLKDDSERTRIRQSSPTDSADLDRLMTCEKLVACSAEDCLERKMPEACRTFTKASELASEVCFSKTNKPSDEIQQSLKITKEMKCDKLLDVVKASNSNDMTGSKDEKSEDDVVWICFVCAKGFPNQSTLVKHQDACEFKPEVNSNEVVQRKPSSSLTSDRNLQMEALRDSDVELVISASENAAIPVPTLLRKVGSNIKSLPLGLPTKTQTFRHGVRRFKDIYIPPNRDLYFESLGLVPSQIVEEIVKSPRKSLTDDDCQIIDLTVDDAQQTVPLTPRTPKSIMSQLSRDDGSGRRRQLSFSSPSQAQKTQKEETDSSSESSTDEVITQPHKVPSKSAILGIPLTSPLGQRLKKHWNYENKVPIIENVESFCKTDPASLACPEVKVKKNRMVEKLRNRPPPQCTFRFTKKYMNKWFHFYKFNKADKYEFIKTLRFGLNRESRLKLKRMKPCNVSLSRISPKDIKYWTAPRTQPRRFLPDTSSLKQYNRRVRQNQIQSAMFPPKYVQGMTMNQMPHQVRNYVPTPQLLVRTVPMGNQGMRLQVLPIQQNTYSPNTSMCKTQKQRLSVAPRELSGSQKRKQIFTNVREDDNMVICLSSDEEDDGKSTKSLSSVRQVFSCAACRVNKESCKIHGRKKIGPASYMLGLLNKPVGQTSLQQINIRDNKAAYPANIISHKPLSTSQQCSYSNTASAKIFGNSFVPTNQASVSSAVNGNSVKYFRIADGKIENCSPSQTLQVAEQVISQPETSWSVPVIKKDVSKTHDSNEIATHSADPEYMDYEVICIDSDDDEV